MTARPTPNRWPIFIILLVVLFCAVTGWSVYRAATRGSSVTDASYYSHGLKYNHGLVEEKAAESLGWSLSTAIAERRLEVRLHDRQGRAVSGAAGEVTLFTVRSGTRTILPLIEIAAGHYTTKFPASLQGELSARLELRRDGARISRSLLVNF